MIIKKQCRAGMKVLRCFFFKKSFKKVLTIPRGDDRINELSKQAEKTQERKQKKFQKSVDKAS
ncbi:TPA: hypothetical protein ACGOVU_002216 [Streptococcus suis]